MLDQTTPLAVFAVADAVREESREAVQRLHQQGIEVIMMTRPKLPEMPAVETVDAVLEWLDHTEMS